MAKVELLEIKGSYEQVANRARTTVSKEELGKDPSDTFKRKILMAEHSPIRSLLYCFKIPCRFRHHIQRLGKRCNRLFHQHLPP